MPLLQFVDWKSIKSYQWSLTLCFDLLQEKKPYVVKAAELKAEYDKTLESSNAENDVRFP